MIREAKWFTELFERYQNDPEYVIEELKLALAEGIEESMERKGLTRSEFARRLGTSPAYVTKLLRGTFNPTLETIARIAIALDARLQLSLSPRDSIAAGLGVRARASEAGLRPAEHDSLSVAEPMAKYESSAKPKRMRRVKSER
jgi:transcriptional regulator with XRE-family HTH domain